MVGLRAGLVDGRDAQGQAKLTSVLRRRRANRSQMSSISRRSVEDFIHRFLPSQLSAKGAFARGDLRLFALRYVSIPRMAGLWFDMGEPRAGRRIRNADEVIAGGTLNLPARVARIALQRLVAVGTIEFELGCIHRLRPVHAQNRRQKYIKKNSSYFLSDEYAYRIECRNPGQPCHRHKNARKRCSALPLN